MYEPNRRWQVTAGSLCLLFLLVATEGYAQSGNPIEARIAELEAREQIRELIYAYGSALDSRNFVAFSELFAEQSGTWVGGFGSATGRAQIFELMDSSIGHAEQPIVPTSHHVFTNLQITVDGNQAEATTKWIFVVPSASGSPQWLYLGHYDDRFVREDGRWLFLRRQAFTDVPVQAEAGTQ